jgi:hypothetical protein
MRSTLTSSVEQGWLGESLRAADEGRLRRLRLFGAGFGALVPQLTDGFDFVVVDTPPVLGTDDTRRLSPTPTATACCSSYPRARRRSLYTRRCSQWRRLRRRSRYRRQPGEGKTRRTPTLSRSARSG